MIKWFKRNQETDGQNPEAELPISESMSSDNVGDEPRGFYARLKQGMNKTRQQLGDGIGRLFLGRKVIDASILEEIETLLLTADLGVQCTQEIVEQVSNSLARKQLNDGETVIKLLKSHLQTLLEAHQKPLDPHTEDKTPFVILMVGINGAGKTTTIGKLARQFQQQGKKVMLAAGDTFRAAAVEQLKVWGERNQIPVIAQHSGADSASVGFDALQAATARGIDVLIVDTAGRLHTQGNLMEELKKVKRVLKKLDERVPHEVMLVLDAGIGQNALNQVREFHQAVGVTGITMTKLDGTAKGGILFAIAKEVDIPFRYIGVGEGIDDLHPFNAEQFIKAIFND